jgi:putative ABC transport system permease protein
MSPADGIGYGQVAGALALVAIAIAVSRWRAHGLEQDIGVAVVRAFLQLTAIGYVIQIVFEQGVALAFVLLGAMVVLGAFTARGRAKAVPDALPVLLLALGLAAGGTLGLVLALGIFEPEAQALVPVGGMVIGNAMTAAAVALNRLGDDVASSRNEIEATLALGATAQQAASEVTRRSLASGLIPLIDQTKTTGLIALPGAMVGMLLGGAEPVDAVRLQMILLYLLLGSVAISALVAVSLGSRRFFTADHQLKDR